MLVAAMPGDASAQDRIAPRSDIAYITAIPRFVSALGRVLDAVGDFLIASPALNVLSNWDLNGSSRIISGAADAGYHFYDSLQQLMNRAVDGVAAFFRGVSPPSPQPSLLTLNDLSQLKQDIDMLKTALAAGRPPAEIRRITERVIERIQPITEITKTINTETKTIDAQSLARIDAALSDLSSRVSLNASRQTAIVENISVGQRIDALRNVTFSGTENKFNLIAADIPANITAANYLPLSGGALSGSLTVNATSTLTGIANTGFITTSGNLSVNSLLTASLFSATNATTTTFAITGSFLANVATSTITNLNAANLITPNLTATGTALNLTGSLLVNAASSTITNLAVANLTLGSALTVSNGGTGQTSFTAGNLLYGSATNGIQNVATSSVTCSSGVACVSFNVVGSGGSIITNTLGYPFTPTSNYGLIMSATSTNLFASGTAGFYASSTSIFSTTTILGSLNTGTVTATSSITTNNLTINGTCTGCGAAQTPDLSYLTVGATKYYTASSTASDNLSWYFKNGFSSTASSSVTNLNVSVINQTGNNLGIGTTSPLSLFSIGTAGNGFRIDSTGTVKEGVWNGSTIAVGNGGTGLSTYTQGDLIYSSAANTLSQRTIGAAGQVLMVSNGLPVWSATSSAPCPTCSTFAYSFTPTSNYGVTMSATTTNLFVSGTAGFYASSTSIFSTTTVLGSLNAGTITATSGTSYLNALTLGAVLPIASGGTNASSFTTSGNAVYYTGSALATAPLTSAITIPYASSTVLSTTNSATFATAGGNVGIGTTTPNWILQVNGTRPFFTLSDTAGGTNLKHWYLSSQGGNLYVGTTTDAYATTTNYQAVIITNAGNVGIGTTSPSTTFSVQGNVLISGTTTVFSGAVGSGLSNTAASPRIAGLNADFLDGFDSSAFGDATAANQTTILNRIGQSTDATTTPPKEPSSIFSALKGIGGQVKNAYSAGVTLLPYDSNTGSGITCANPSCPSGWTQVTTFPYVVNDRVTGCCSAANGPSDTCTAVVCALPR